MSLVYTAHFLRCLKKKVRKNPALKQKISRQIKLLQENEHHPALRLHSLKGKRASELAIDIESNLRITLMKIEGKIFLTDIITHDEY